MIDRRAFLAGSTLALVGGASAQAQSDYPNKPVRFVVPFAAGGPTDAVCRRLAEDLFGRWGQHPVVDNRSGGNTLIGMDAVLKAPADGYNALVTNPTIVQLPSLMKVSYDPYRDFSPITKICNVPLVLVTTNDYAAPDLNGVVRKLQEVSDGTSYGSPGFGGTQNILSEEFSRTFNLKAQIVPYRGESAVIPDLLTNRVHWMFATPSQVVSFVKQGALKAVAVTGTERLAKMPDVPTFEEFSVNSFRNAGWYGMFVSSSTPAGVVAKLSASVLEAVRADSFKAFLDENMWVPQGLGADAFKDELASMSATWVDLIKKNDIRIQ
jgi:tripartite-type tricarboxylate transporter receptor subunit TctC